MCEVMDKAGAGGSGDEIRVNEEKPDFSRIVAVTSRKLCSRPFPEQIRRVCSCHPRALILREKDLTEEEYRRLAEEVLAICRKYGVEMIPHTFVNVAAELGTECVHLPLPLLRELSGSAVLRRFSRIGTSVHSPEEAAEAERLGAAYMTAGHIYATDCKRGLPPRGLEYLREVCRSTSLPVLAIGGIPLDEERIREVLEAGAAGACVMSGMMRI
jgi:thiamine-phosphate pyrophosphorylase